MLRLLISALLLFGLMGLEPATCFAQTGSAAPPSPGAQPAAAAAVTGTAAPDPNCGAKVSSTAVENPKVAIVLDPKTAWQPRGGVVSFVVSGNAADLGGMKVVVCFGWPAADGTLSTFPYGGRLSLVAFAPNSATYNVVVPDLSAAEMPLYERRAPWTVPTAFMRVIVSGAKDAPTTVDVQIPVGITHPALALVLAILAVVVAGSIFYAFARIRGVPGKGFVLWMISTPNGFASLSQAQVVLWTFLIGAAAVYVMALTGVLIDLSDGTLVLLGISGVAIAGSKLQNSQQDAKAAAQPDGKTAVPGPVTGVSIADATVTDTEVRLSWNPPTTGGPVSQYIVEYRPTPAQNADPAWAAVGETITRPRHTVLGLMPDTEYQFRVTAANAGGPGEASGISTQRTSAAPGGTNAALRIGGLHVEGCPTLTAVNLAWSQPSGTPSRYAVQYRRHDTGDGWIDATGPSPSKPIVTLDRLISGAVYDFRVAAINDQGTGPWSAVTYAQTLREPQWSDLVISGEGRGQIDVTRAQMLFFTLIAAVFVGLKVLSSYIIPEIPQSILLLMGISNGVYMTAKFIPD